MTDFGADLSFTTEVAAQAITQDASDVTSSGFTLNGTVNPNGVDSVAYFQYGGTTAYGNRTRNQFVGSGITPVPVSQQVAGLQQLSNYHFRIVLDDNIAPPVGDYGFLLPDRIAASTGSVVAVSNKSQLDSALATIPLGGIIDLGGNTINCGGVYALWNRAGGPSTVTTIRNGKLTNGDPVRSALRLESSAYFRIEDIEIDGGGTATDCIKVTNGSSFTDISNCTLYGAARQGILFGGASDWQVWDSYIHSNGTTNTQDHNIYASTASGDCVIGSCLIRDARGYNLQLYPHSVDLIVTGCTIDGGISSSNPRGGVIIGDEDGSSTHDVLVVGCIVTNAPNAAGFQAFHGGANNQVQDCIAFGNSGGSFATGYGGGGPGHPLIYTNCTTADPLYVSTGSNYHLQGGSPAIGYVDEARFGYLPATDFDGNNRVTADAGCFAA